MANDPSSSSATPSWLRPCRNASSRSASTAAEDTRQYSDEQNRFFQLCRNGSLDDMKSFVSSLNNSMDLDLALVQFLALQLKSFRDGVPTDFATAIAMYCTASDQMRRIRVIRGFVPWFDPQEVERVTEIGIYLANLSHVDLTAQSKPGGATALHLATLLGTEPLLVQHILSQPIIIVNAQDDYGNTPLHFAVGTDSPSNARAVLQHPLVDINLRNFPDTSKMMWNQEMLSKFPVQLDSYRNYHLQQLGGDACLHVALRLKREELCLVLMEHATVETRTLPDQDGCTVLSLAVAANCVELVQQLLQCPEVDCNFPDFLQRAPLHHVLGFEWSPSMASALLQHNAVNINAPNADGDTILFHAINYEEWELVDQCLNHPQIDLRIVNKRGETALHIASRQGYLPLVQTLIHRDLELVGMKTNRQETVLHFVVSTFCDPNSQIPVLEFLLQQQGIEVNAQDHQGDTVLHKVCRPQGYVMTDERLNQQCQIVDCLLGHPDIQLSLKNKNGQTVLEASDDKAMPGIYGRLKWMELILLSRSIEGILQKLPPSFTTQEQQLIQNDSDQVKERGAVVLAETDEFHYAVKSLQLLYEWLPRNWQNFPGKQEAVV